MILNDFLMFFKPGTGSAVPGVAEIIKTHMGVDSFPLVHNSGHL